MNTELTFNSCYNYTGRKGKKYYGHREKAMSNPNKCNTIIIDGFDQYKTNLPRLSKTLKAVQGLLSLRTHIIGVLVHTKTPHCKLASIFVDLLQLFWLLLITYFQRNLSEGELATYSCIN